MDYQSFLEHLRQPVCGFYADGRITFANSAFRELCDAADNLAGRNIFALFPKAESAELRMQCDLLSGAVPESSFTLTRTVHNAFAGCYVWKCRGVFGDDGRAREYQLTGSDEAIHPKPFVEPRKPGPRIREIVEAVADGFVAVDRAWRLSFIDDRTCARYGMDGQSLIGKVIWDRFPVLNSEPSSSHLRYAMRERIPVRFQMAGFLSGHWLDVTLHPSRDGLYISWRDDEERRSMEAKLQEKEANLASLLESSTDIIWTVDRDGRLVTANNAFRRLFLQVYGLKAERGLPVLDSIAAGHPGDWQRMFDRALGGLSTAREQHFDFAGMHLDGEITCRPVKGRDGEITAVSYLVRDVSLRARAEHELRENEEKFRTFASLAPAGMFMADADGNYRYVNARWCSLAGMEPSQASGSGWEDSIHPEDREAVTASWQAAVAGGTAWEREYRMRGADGAGIWVLGQAAPLHGQHGTVSGYAGVNMDISGRKRVEELERARKELYQNLFRDSNAFMMLIDPGTGIIRDANPAACRFYGYSREDIIQVDLGALCGLPANEALLLLSDERRAAVRQFRAGGDQRDMEISCTTVVIEGETLLYVIASDVTERRRLEEKNCELQQFNQAVIDGAGTGIAVCDKNNRFNFWNRFMEKMTGIAAHEAMGRKPDDIFSYSGAMLDTVNRMRQRVIAGETVELADVRYHVPLTGRSGWYSAVFAPHRDAAGAIVGITGMLTEISGRKMIERSIEQSERRFREVLEHIHMGAVMLDATGHITFCNDYLLHLTGYKRTEVMGRVWPELFVPSHKRERWKEYYAQVLQENKSLFVEMNEIVSRDGRRIYMSWNNTIIRDDNGHPAGVTSIGEDITERVRAGRALQESEQKLRGFIEQSVDGIALLDNDGLITEWNQAASVITGQPRDKMLGMPAWDVQFSVLPEEQRTPENYQLLKTHIEQMLQDKHGTKHGALREFEIVTAAGERRTVQHVLFPVVYGHNRTLCSIARDVTDLNRARAALTEAEARYTVVADTIGMGIAFISRDRKVLGMNRQMKVWNPDLDLSDRPICYQAFHKPAKNGPCEGCPVEITFADGEIHEGISEVKTPAGSRFYRIVSSPVKDLSGRISMVIEFVEDVTEKRIIEEELVLYQDKLRSASAELSIVEERERRRIAVYLHDNIGQALAMAKLKLSEVMAGADLSSSHLASLKEAQQFIGQSIQYGRSLTFELSLPILYELGLAAAFDWLAEDFRKRHGLNVTVRRSGAAVDADNEVRVILFRVVRELLMNVVKHAAAASAELSIMMHQRNIHIVVEDRGAGFDGGRFTGLAQGRSGFGLFSIREQVAYLGGTVNIVSSPGRGTRITIISPLKFMSGAA